MMIEKITQGPRPSDSPDRKASQAETVPNPMLKTNPVSKTHTHTHTTHPLRQSGFELGVRRELRMRGRVPRPLVKGCLHIGKTFTEI